jgi:hypothetical protein
MEIQARKLDREFATLEAITAAIVCSPIVTWWPQVRLPVGFEKVDIEILEWIAAEGRRIGRGYALM